MNSEICSFDFDLILNLGKILSFILSQFQIELAFQPTLPLSKLNYSPLNALIEGANNLIIGRSFNIQR